MSDHHYAFVKATTLDGHIIYLDISRIHAIMERSPDRSSVDWNEESTEVFLGPTVNDSFCVREPVDVVLERMKEAVRKIFSNREIRDYRVVDANEGDHHAP